MMSPNRISEMRSTGSRSRSRSSPSLASIILRHFGPASNNGKAHHAAYARSAARPAAEVTGSSRRTRAAASEFRRTRGR
jgi:hypothetical protein